MKPGERPAWVTAKSLEGLLRPEAPGATFHLAPLRGVWIKVLEFPPS
jgi:hypothetical protein